jgi:T5SS/PEP-CTERM-associated repeat protein
MATYPNYTGLSSSGVSYVAQNGDNAPNYPGYWWLSSSGGGSWSNPSNWYSDPNFSIVTPAGPPGPGDSASIGGDGVTRSISSGDATVALFGCSDVTLTGGLNASDGIAAFNSTLIGTFNVGSLGGGGNTTILGTVIAASFIADVIANGSVLSAGQRANGIQMNGGVLDAPEIDGGTMVGVVLDASNILFGSTLTNVTATVGTASLITVNQGSLTATGLISQSTLNGGTVEAADLTASTENNCDLTVSDTIDHSSLIGGTVQAGTISNGTIIDGASVTATQIDPNLFDVFTVKSGSLTVTSALNFQGNSFVGIEDNGTLNATGLTIGGEQFTNFEGSGFFEVAGSQAQATISGQVTLQFGIFNVGSDTGNFSGASGGTLTLQDGLSVLGNTFGIVSGGKASITGDVLVDETQGLATNDGITVDGAGSRFTVTGQLVLAQAYQANLAVTNYAFAEINGGMVLGNNVGSSGMAEVSGLGSLLIIHSQLIVGESGNGSVEATNGSTLIIYPGTGGLSGAITGDLIQEGIAVFNFTFPYLIIGDQVGSHGAVRIDDATLDFHLPVSAMTVGNFGSGILNIVDGGSAEVRTLQVGANGSNDTATVSGYYHSTPTPAGVSKFDSAIVTIGSPVQGAGDQLNVSNYAQMSISSTLHIWQGGSVSLASLGTLAVGNPSEPVPPGSVLSIAAGGIVISNGTISASLVVDEGLLEVGGYYQANSVGGTCTINGNITGNLLVASANANSADVTGDLFRVAVNGQVVIDPGATLELNGGDIATNTNSPVPIEFQGLGAGTLQLDQPGAFAGAITNLAEGDTVVLRNTTVANYSLQQQAELVGSNLTFTDQYVLSISTQTGQFAYTISFNNGLTFPNSVNDISLFQLGSDAVFTVTGAARDTVSGKAIDGALSGATVFADTNGNGQLDPGESSTTTDSGGNFSLTSGSGPLVVFGGTDVSTGLPFIGQMEAPSGSTVITPLTTLLTYLQNQGATSVAQAETQILAALNISLTVDITTLDPVAAAVAGDPDGVAVLIADATVMNTVDMIASAFAGVGATNAYHDTFAALASIISGLGQSGTLDLTDKATISTLITNAAKAEGLNVSQIVDGISTIVAAANGAIDNEVSSDQNGYYVSDVTAVELVAQGAISAALQADGGNPTKTANTLTDFTGENLTNAIAAAKLQLAPTVSSLTAATDTGATVVNAGHVVTITMNLSEAVTVTGTPTLQLNDNEVAAYTFGSGSNTLSFSYVAQTGDNVADLHVTGLNLPTGASIADGSGGSLAGPVNSDLGIQVDTVTVPLTSVQQQVLGLYGVLYTRAADFGGLSYWTGVVGQQPDGAGVTVANGASTAITINDATVLGQLFVSTESSYFNQVYGSMSDSAFITTLYGTIGGNTIGIAPGIAYWSGVLQALETAGQSQQAARAGIVGEIVQAMIDYNINIRPAGYTDAEWLAAQQRQETTDNKVAVSLAFSNASQQPGGNILDAVTVTDAAFLAATRVIEGVTYNGTTADAAISNILHAVALQDLTQIQPIGVVSGGLMG